LGEIEKVKEVITQEMRTDQITRCLSKLREGEASLITPPHCRRPLQVKNKPQRKFSPTRGAYMIAPVKELEAILSNQNIQKCFDRKIR
jgi:hypothetical protein